MSFSTNVAVIVDAYSSAAKFAGSFHQKGFSCVHIQSSPEIPDILKKAFRPNDFIENLIFTENTSQIIESLSKYNVKCVIAGCELGVKVADIFSELLNLRTNGTALSDARRNKYLMDKALQNAGLPTPKFSKISSWEELVDWKDTNEIKYPIVLKPLNSAATDGVYISANDEELEQAFNAIHGKQNLLGFTNNQILAQSFLKGQEYIVNTVSLDEKMYVVAILKGKKKFLEGRGFIYDREIMVKREGEKQNQLVAMHEKVIKALGIKNGPAHGEYMFTEEGPILIEVAARIAGGVNPKANDESVGCNQMDLTVNAYVDPSSFHKQAEHNYIRRRHCYDVEISAPHEGVVTNAESYVKSVKNLPSFSCMVLKVEEGAKIPRTVDLISSISNVFLVHEDKEVVKSDYQKLLQLTESLIKPN